MTWGWYDKEGKLIGDIDEYISWLNFNFGGETQDFIDYRQVGLDRLKNGVVVSTVLLGLDHSFVKGPPLIFETLTRSGEGEFTQRYSTLAEAEAGHKAQVLRWRGREVPEAEAVEPEVDDELVTNEEKPRRLRLEEKHDG